MALAILGIFALMLIPLAFWIWSILDVLAYSDEAWETALQKRTTQIVLHFVLGAVGALFYVLTVRPALRRAQDLTGAPAATAKPPTWAKVAIGGVVAWSFLLAMVLGYQVKMANDLMGDLSTGSGVPLPVRTPESFSHRPLTAIVLSNEEIEALEDHDSDTARAIWDATLIPRLQGMMDQVTANFEAADDGRFDTLAPTWAAAHTFDDIAGVQERTQICHTTPNISGTLNSCDREHYSEIELGEGIDLWYHDFEDDEDRRFTNKFTRAEIVDGNRLILANDTGWQPQ